MKFTTEEINTIEYALSDRETAMFRDYEAYKDNGNKEAMMDCLKEMKNVNALRERIHNEQCKTA